MPPSLLRPPTSCAPQPPAPPKIALPLAPPPVQFNLAAMYIGGMGVKKAFDKALHYFTLSAHQGHSLALYNLGQVRRPPSPLASHTPWPGPMSSLPPYPPI